MDFFFFIKHNTFAWMIGIHKNVNIQLVCQATKLTPLKGRNGEKVFYHI